MERVWLDSQSPEFCCSMKVFVHVCVCVWQSYRHEDGCADAKLWPKATIFNISYMASLSPIKDLNRTITTTTAETKNWIQRRTEERVWRTVCECVCYPLAQRNRHAYTHAYIHTYMNWRPTNELKCLKDNMQSNRNKGNTKWIKIRKIERKTHTRVFFIYHTRICGSRIEQHNFNWLTINFANNCKLSNMSLWSFRKKLVKLCLFPPGRFVYNLQHGFN